MELEIVALCLVAVGRLHRGTVSPTAGLEPRGYHGDSVHSVRMYSRRRCGLCDEARAVIEAEGEGSPLEFEEVFIDGSEALEHEYGLRVPVVEVDGVERFEYHVDPGRLHDLLG